VRAEQKGSDLLLDIDVQGAEQIKRKLPQAVSIFILPPNRSELEKRLRKPQPRQRRSYPAPAGYGLS